MILAASAMRAQSVSPSEPPATCDAARQRLRAELSLAARQRGIASWSAERASLTSTGQTITRTQRLLYDRARASLLASVALLDSLSPLHGDLDDATLDEARPVLRARLRELASELERRDGPRLEQMDRSLATAASLVARLGLVLCRGAVTNTEAEGRTLDAFVRIEEVVRMARRDWSAAGLPRLPATVAAGPALTAPASAAPAAAPLLDVAGITDTLDTVVQSMEELQSALEAMQLAPEQRDSIVALDPAARRVSLAELLVRVERFATDEVPRLLEAGGAADDLPLLRATSDTLRQLARSLRVAPVDASLEDGSAEAQGALDRLAQRLDVLYRLLAPPGAP